MRYVIEVYGTPIPQGSKRAFALRKGGVLTGKVAMAEQAGDRLKTWRSCVTDAALRICTGPSLCGPLTVYMIFYMPRPKSHYGTGRNAGRLKPAAPAFPSGTPDLSKLARSTEDALTDSGAWRDDAQVVQYTLLAKSYITNERRLPGAWIEIAELES